MHVSQEPDVQFDPPGHCGSVSKDYHGRKNMAPTYTGATFPAIISVSFRLATRPRAQLPGLAGLVRATCVTWPIPFC
jgi:hypothetical protein